MGFIRNFLERRRIRGKNGTVRRMFMDRAEKFTIVTNEILKRMPGALEAISDLIEERESFKKGGVLSWDEVSLVDAGSENALIILVGTVTFPAGAEVVLETGEKVTVTPDTAQYFPPRMIRVGFPLSMAEATKQEISDYIRKADAEREKDAEQIKQTLKDVLGVEFVTENDEEGTEPPSIIVKKQDDTVTSGADFDLTQLTEEQRQQLILSTKMGRG